MSSWWNKTSASNFTRGLTSITGQLSSNLKDILTEASEENYDPTAELTRARQQIEDLDLRKQALMEECTSLKKQCDEVTMQKQAVEIKSDMLLAESRRVLEEKDNELKRLRESTSTVTWNNPNDLNNTWTDILEDDQTEINEYLKYQRTIRELKDENSHLRDEMDEVDKDLLSQELEQANNKLNCYSEKLKEYLNLQTNMDSLILQNKQLENNLQLERQNNKLNLEHINQYEEKIHQLQQDIIRLH
ncbi:unnamed protein product [Rotaria sp. Silwood2]|nr:unnamed protein product [Rotaria sp. Silwood2]